MAWLRDAESIRSPCCPELLNFRLPESPVAPFGFAFFKKGLHAFFLIFGAKATEEQIALGHDATFGGVSYAASTASLASRTASGACFAISPPMATMASANPSVGSTRLTNPMRRASLASSMRPVRHMSMAIARPTLRASLCVPPPGMTPMLTSGCPNLALSDATARSHNIAKFAVPPKATTHASHQWGADARSRSQSWN